MRFDVEGYLGAVTRSVAAYERDGKPVRAVTLARTYETTVEDLWDAATSKERLPRWFLPVSGELRPGGRYKLEGNAEGAIERCEPPTFLAVTWEFGGGVSWVEARLSAETKRRSRLTLTHIAPLDEHWEKYGAGAGGVGWEFGLVGLAMHLAGEARLDEAAVAASPEGKDFVAKSSEAWGAAEIAGGESAAQAKARAKATSAFYRGEAS